MPEIKKDEALALLTREVEHFELDELLEVYNELFSREPYEEAKARQDARPLVKRLVDFLSNGLNEDEIVAMWELIIPKHRNVWYNEEDDIFSYNEEIDSLLAE